MKLQKAVKQETRFVAATTGAGCLVMLLLFYILHRTGILGRVPFGPPEIVSGVIGWFIATLNFFMMAVSVQKVASLEDQRQARQAMTVSYRYRTILQIAWAAVSILVKFFNPAAGIIPLFIPSIMIKLRGILSGRNGSKANDNTEGEVKA